MVLLGSIFQARSNAFTTFNTMKLLVEISGCFEHDENLNGLCLSKSPFPIPTEREAYALARGLPIYRVTYARNNKPIPDLLQLEETYKKFQCLSSK